MVALRTGPAVGLLSASQSLGNFPATPSFLKLPLRPQASPNSRPCYQLKTQGKRKSQAQTLTQFFPPVAAESPFRTRLISLDNFWICVPIPSPQNNLLLRKTEKLRASATSLGRSLAMGTGHWAQPEDRICPETSFTDMPALPL